MRHLHEFTTEDKLRTARETAYTVVTGMNREERRTAKGRVLVAQAEAAALRTENEILREALVKASNN